MTVEKMLSGRMINQRIQYWSSYEDHIKRIENEIKKDEEDIEQTKKDIKELKKELKRVKSEKKEFEEDDYKPSYKFAKDFEEKNPEFCSNALKKIKAHELKNHRDLVETKKVLRPRYEFVSSGSDPFKIKYIYCMDCLEKYGTYDDYILKLENEDGAK